MVIYQATNFIYTGATKPRTDKYTPNGKHSRHYDKNGDNSLRKIRSAKHRYIYFCGDKRTIKNYRNNLRYNVLGYPKGENSNYILGVYKEDKIIQNH